MIQPRITVRPEATKAMLAEVGNRQMPFAMALGVNLLGKAGQKAVQDDRLRGHFRLRRQAWNLNAIRISKEDRATKTSWKVIVQVDPRAGYLDKFEEAGIHEPFGGRRYLWVPEEAVFRNKVIQGTNALHPRNLHMHRVGGQLVGAQRTFMVKGKEDDRIFVLQRVDRRLTKNSEKRLKKMDLENVAVGVGPQQKGILGLQRTNGTRTLYHLRERVRVPLKLEFIPTVARTVQIQAEPVFREAIRRTLATAR